MKFRQNRCAYEREDRIVMRVRLTDRCQELAEAALSISAE